jgi:flagellar protein FlaG
MKIDMVNSTGTMQNVEGRTDSADTTYIAKDKIEMTDAVDPSKLRDAVDKLNKKTEETNYDVQFAVYKDTNRIIVQVVDKTTKEVVSTFPPKQILEMAAMVDKEFKIFDKKI